MPRKEYTGISVKKELGQAIAKFIADHSEYGYRNVADFASESMRLRLQDIKRDLSYVSEKKK